uniref:Uncharacterized protein n=1 Tax=Candidatus Kentrum sp. SD TaxID=2126332 RepID=A0A450Z783_9GAMM|nr:MAG: hypothetical protein BECKSD772F_GA0070984_12059 [Candidatus Kentron sp. SD]VFK49644.1 MAG: hypothetical protein BECKSD772E_GA0070983_12079 [Candidatus Kentron sp. SD]VFK80948.1 MAG: hypothetical protein BECKSD772D_GA0070982_11832 [Candidatus Kentron sp. SD]
MRNIICFVVFLLYSWQTSAEVLVDENVSGGSGQNIRHFQVVEYDSAIPQATIFYTDGYGNLKFLVAELHGYNSGWNFENGLTGWSVTGDAFNYQPTKGDNPTARNRGQPSRHKGDYWIGTYEKYNDNTGSPGSVQGDRPIGEVITNKARLCEERATI